METNLLAHRGWLVIQICGRNPITKKKINGCRLNRQLASWNVRTLLDTLDQHERRSAIIGRELARYGIDIAALSGTRISGVSKFVELGVG